MKFQLGLMCIIASIGILYADSLPVLSYFPSGASSHVQVGEFKSSDSFLSTLKANVKSSLEIIWLNQLSAEDLKPMFKKYDLVDEEGVHYEPQVDSPYELLKSFETENSKIQVNWQEMSNLEDALLLFKHKTQALKSVVLTGKHLNALNVRARRSVDDAEVSNQTVSLFGKECATFFDSISFRDMNNQSAGLVYLLIDHEHSTFDCDDNKTQSLTIKFGPNQGYTGTEIDHMTLSFQLSPNQLYWVLGSASINFANTTSNDSMPLVYMGAPYGMETPRDFSFACTRTSFIVSPPASQKGANNRVWFYIEKFQLQPVNVNNNGTEYAFGRINYCQGFFSSGIWMAISASLILTLILAFGVSLLFNVKPLDRFDDPKGKPLNIGAEK